MWSVLWWLACAPTLDDPTPYVDAPRVLAVRASPPEVVAGGVTSLEALFADGSGRLDEGEVDWAFCATPKPLAELGPLAPACLEPGSDALAPIGAGLAVDATVPLDACSLFGPNPPPPVDGEPAGRPTDPDFTGGYYQPVLAFPAASGALMAPLRVRCGLANVSQEAYVAWNRAYRSNENPVITGLVVRRGEEVLEVDGDTPVIVAPGERLTWSVAWQACPETDACGDGVCGPTEEASVCEADCAVPRGCGGAETYVVFDPATSGLVSRREAISATWFVTGGVLDDARTGRAGEDAATDAGNAWEAPAAPGDVWASVVLRDERGGVDYRSFRLRVAE